MKIQWLGHSCFKLVESTGTTIVTDPYGDVGYQMPLTRADAVTISHDHYDHNNLKAIEGNPPVFTQPGLYDVKGVRVTGVSSFHDDRKGAQRGKNTIFMFHMDGLDICHLGDVGHEITPALVESLMSCNVLLIPVGGTFFSSMASSLLSGVSLSTVALRILIFMSLSSMVWTLPRMITDSYREVVLHAPSSHLSNPFSSTTVKQHLGSLLRFETFSPTFLPWKKILPSMTTKLTGVP